MYGNVAVEPFPPPAKHTHVGICLLSFNLSSICSFLLKSSSLGKIGIPNVFI